MVTSTTGNIVYAATVPVVPIVYPELFKFTSVEVNGGVLYNGSNASGRYPANYTTEIGLINIAATTNLSVTVSSASTVTFATPVYINVYQDGTLIYTAETTDAVYSFVVPASSVTDSSAVYSDGVSGTYASTFAVALNTGSMLSEYVHPGIVLALSGDGVMYSASHRVALSGSETNFGIMTGSQQRAVSATMIVHGASGTVPFAGIVNHTLGGYLVSADNAGWNASTYIINNDLNSINPRLNIDILNGDTYALGAYMGNTAYEIVNGEVDVSMCIGREIVVAPETPTYTINTSPSGVGLGNIAGAGSFLAGTIQSFYAYPVGLSQHSGWVLQGQGVNTYKIGEIGIGGGTSFVQTFVDGNKTFISGFAGDPFTSPP